MWISNKAYNELVNKAKKYKSQTDNVYNYYNENVRLEKELIRTRRMLWNLQSECDEKDIYRKLGKKSQMCNSLKLQNKELEKELKEAYETISQLEKERQEIEKETIKYYADIIKNFEKEHEQLKEKNKKQTEIILKQMKKLYKKEAPVPLND